ncbi:type II and III secretion system protein family protein [Mitsuokella jalaludinii]|uniref:type II and III secretion system protein family protein n=1 Tax=Mitsuokella jalaludinii TaxID=187979 RepID=UPI003F978CE5
MRTILSGLTASAITAAVLMAPAPACAQYTPVAIDLNQSYYLNTGRSITRVAIANPKIADVSLVDRSSLNIIGISPGTTTLNVWASNGYRYEYRVTVSNQDSGLAKIVQEAIDLPGVRVQMIGGKILLRGAVKNQYERDLAYKIAKLYAGTGGSSGTASSGKSQSSSSSSGGSSLQSLGSSLGSSDDARGDIDDSVVNMLEMTNPDQINIEAMFVELSSNDARKLGINYASQDMSDTGSNSGITMNNAGTFYAGESYGSQRSGGSHWYNRNWLFTHFSKINAEIHALIENGKARVVSRPNVTTMSGKDAKILIGGEIPYESSNGFGSTTTEYKEYGIGLDLKAPTVDQDGNITTELETQVSRLDWNNAVTKDGYRMPGIATRSAYTTVNIPSGMTMVIGGLLNSDDAKTIQKVPLLGSIPLIGELFKYHNNSHTRTEIVVLITPRIVSEETPARMSADMEDTYNDSRRADRSMKQVDLNGDIPEKSNEQLAKEAKAAEKAAKKNAAANQHSSALTTRVETGSSEAPGNRIKATAREILSRMDK